MVAFKNPRRLRACLTIAVQRRQGIFYHGVRGLRNAGGVKKCKTSKRVYPRLPLDFRFEAERGPRRRRSLWGAKKSWSDLLRISQIYSDLLRFAQICSDTKELLRGEKRGKAGKSGKVWEVEQ